MGVLHHTKGCYTVLLGVIEYCLGAAGVRTSAILTFYTLRVCSYTPQISPLTFGIFTAIRSVQVSMHHACWDTALLLPVRASNIWTNLVWFTIASGMKMLVMNDHYRSGETTNTTMENIRLWMYTPNGYHLSSLVMYCFRLENVGNKSQFHTSDKITTAPKLFSKYFIRNENKHQIMNVHTKWNCLIPILCSLDKNYLFQSWKR